jgi:hypothetical protein
MRLRILLAILGLSILLSVWLTLQTQRAITAPSRRESRAAATIAPPPPPPLASAEIQRNPFEYADTRPPAPRPAVVRRTTAPPAEQPTPTPAPAVTLVGIVHRAGGPRAALSIEGQVSIAGRGETVDGYTVLEVDPNKSVRLRTPEGVELALVPPS